MHGVERPPARGMEQPMVPVVEIVHDDKVETKGHEPGDGEHALETGSHGLTQAIDATRSESRDHETLHEQSGTVYHPIGPGSGARRRTPPTRPQGRDCEQHKHTQDKHGWSPPTLACHL